MVAKKNYRNLIINNLTIVIVTVVNHYHIEKIPSWSNTNFVDIKPTTYYYHIDSINVNYTNLVISTMCIVNFKVCTVLLFIVQYKL